jgi:gamma-glutamyltranspeptidase/glutathione hydrolase
MIRVRQRQAAVPIMLSASPRRTRHALGWALALGCVWGAASAPAQGNDVVDRGGWKASGRYGVVAAGKAESVAAGIAILEAGGNAADAAVATILASSVTDYGLCCIGAEAPMLIYDARLKEVKVLDGIGGAPRSPEAIRWYLENGIHRGMKSAAVPAAVSACFELLKRYGTMTFEQVATPTLALLNGGKVPRQPKLAATLSKLIETERGTRGTRGAKLQATRDRFYKGDIAVAIADWYVEEEGFLRKADLAAHVTQIEDPVKVSYRGCVVAKCGPWTQGPALCQTLRLLERFDLKAMGRGSADNLHVCAEALKLALADRDAYYGDPLFVKVPLDRLLSDAYTALRVPLINLKSASREVRPGDPVGLKALGAPGEHRPTPGGSTTCCVADRWGNVVAATPSGIPPYISPVGGETGVDHGTRLTSLNTVPGHPNCIAPGKRPRVALTPTLVLKDGKPLLAISVAGGDLQDQATLNLLLNFIEFGMKPEAAVTAPRFATRQFDGSFNPTTNRAAAAGTLTSLQLNDGFGDGVAQDLSRRGHKVTRTAGLLGNPVMIWIDPATGIAHAAGDPRGGRCAGAAGK